MIAHREMTTMSLDHDLNRGELIMQISSASKLSGAASSMLYERNNNRLSSGR